MKIFIASLPFNISEADVFNAFAQFGAVSSVKIINDRATGKSRGFGFIEMPDDQKASKAIQELDGADVNGRTVVVRRADKKEDDASRPNPFFSNYQEEDQSAIFTKRPRKPIH